MIRGDTQLVAKDGLVHGVPKHSVRPIIDGIVTGIPRKAVPSAATPVSACMPSATPIPHGAFGSGVFGEGAGAAGSGHSSRHRPETPPEMEKKKHGTTKGEPRKTARKAYEK